LNLIDHMNSNSGGYIHVENPLTAGWHYCNIEQSALFFEMLRKQNNEELGFLDVFVIPNGSPLFSLLVPSVYWLDLNVTTLVIKAGCDAATIEHDVMKRVSDRIKKEMTGDVLFVDRNVLVSSERFEMEKIHIALSMRSLVMSRAAL
jgi:hypothetical protein